MLVDEGLDQIVNPIDHQAAPRLLLFLGWISSIEPGRKDLLRLCASHRQGDSSIGTDGELPQSRSCAGQAIHYQKDLAALWRHLHAKAR